MKDVELTIANATKCICPVCPVQADSTCTAAKRPGWERERIAAGDVLAEYPDHPEAYDMDMAELETAEVGKRHDFEKPDAEAMIELYCRSAATGSDCEDLDATKSCQCPLCAVWATHQLVSEYYCLRGR